MYLSAAAAVTDADLSNHGAFRGDSRLDLERS